MSAASDPVSIDNDELSPKPRGDGLALLIQTMDRLRSPDGCPWDAAQTHQSLAKYAIEEAHELAEAAENGDRAELREELGDVLLQVVFHSRVAEEDPDDPFDIDDVARGVVAKLTRRHPHVFADVTAETPAEVAKNWEEIKRIEKSRESIIDGIPVAMPALARAQKLIGRARRANLDLKSAVDGLDPGVGTRLLGIIVEAETAGQAAEDSLRATIRELESAIRTLEAQGNSPKSM